MCGNEKSVFDVAHLGMSQKNVVKTECFARVVEPAVLSQSKIKNSDAYLGTEGLILT